MAKMMRAMQVTELGKPLERREVPQPTPGSGEVLVRVRAVGINFADLLMQKGQYQERPELPFTLGMEASGIVEAVGEGVNELKPGMRVMAYGGSGALAEHALFPAALTVEIPDDMPFEEAAAFPIAYGTSHVALEHRARLQPGERLLVLGAAGGVGLTAVEIGRLMGAEVIAVARGPERLAVAERAGAQHLIDSESEDIRIRVKELGGADVVYDPVGGDAFEAAMRATNPEGRLIPIGFVSGKIPQIPANILLVKNLTVIGLYWGGYVRFRPEVIGESFRKLLEWYRKGQLHPHVSHKVPLEEAEAALELLRARKATGKVVVTV